MAYKNKQDLYRNQVQRWIKRKINAIGALHFHHREPKLKTADWSKIRLWNWKRIEQELDKCDLLCANCHAESHMN